VTYVSDEVTADRFNAALIGKIFDNDKKDVLAQQRDLRANVQVASAQWWTWHAHFALSSAAVADDMVAQVSDLGDAYALTAGKP
jgi:hypothetical protein